MTLSKCGKFAKYSLVTLAVYGILTGIFGIISSMYQASQNVHQAPPTSAQQPTNYVKGPPTRHLSVRNASSVNRSNYDFNPNFVTEDPLFYPPSPREVVYTSAMTVFLSSLAIIGSLLEQVIVLITFCLLMTLSLLMRLLNASVLYRDNELSAPDTSVLIAVFIFFSAFECSLIILSVKLALDIRRSKIRDRRGNDPERHSIRRGDRDDNQQRPTPHHIARDSIPITIMNEISFNDDADNDANNANTTTSPDDAINISECPEVDQHHKTSQAVGGRNSHNKDCDHEDQVTKVEDVSVD